MKRPRTFQPHDVIGPVAGGLGQGLGGGGARERGCRGIVNSVQVRTGSQSTGEGVGGSTQIRFEEFHIGEQTRLKTLPPRNNRVQVVKIIVKQKGKKTSLNLQFNHQGDSPQLHAKTERHILFCLPFLYNLFFNISYLEMYQPVIKV